ncbi:MAG: YigZ family protein [Calditrichia bacterium]
MEDIRRVETKVKGSQFIGTLSPAENETDAEKFLESIRKEFHNATHNCFAYRVDESVFRYSDDGEPSGTAGRPILSMIDKYHLIKVVMVVTRYFGGTKLGTGGLIRAYSECAEEAVKGSRIRKKLIYEQLRISYPFEMINKVQHLVQKYEARIQDDASPEGMVSVIGIAPSRIEEFKTELISATAGKAEFLENNEYIG